MKKHGRFKSFDGTRIAYRIYGEKSSAIPLIFCSGIACDDTYWTKIAPQLSTSRPVVTWDYPYHGDSGAPGQRGEVTIPSLARHADRLLTELHFDTAGFAGHSMGVQVILEFFRLFKERVSALIPIAGPYERTVGSLYDTGFGRYALTLLGAGIKLQPDMTTLLWRAAFTPAIADPIGRAAALIGRAPAETMAAYFRHVQSMDVAGLLEMFQAAHGHSASDVLETIDVPCLIIHGKADMMTPFRIAQEMAKRIPNASLIPIEEGAHTLPAEEPDFISAAVDDFLADKLK